MSKEIDQYFKEQLKRIRLIIEDIKEKDGEMDTVSLLEKEQHSILNILERKGDFLLIH